MKPAQRISNWPRALDAYVEACRHRPFTWGRHDCLLFAAGAVKAIAGADPAKGKRGKYRSEAGAQKLIHANGGWHKLITACAKGVGMKPVKTALAQRGDVVTARLGIDKRSAAGVCLGAEAAFPGEQGLEFHPLAACHRNAWRVE